MKCDRFRDLAEILRDGAFEGPGGDGAVEGTVAVEARSHLARCGACREFEAECAAFLAPLTGFPPGPWAPPSSPWRLPPWASGPALGVLMALILGAGVAAWGLARPGRPADADATGPRVASAAPAPAAAKAGHGSPPAGAPPGSPSNPAAGGGTSLTGRVVGVAGGNGLAGVRVRLDGVDAGTTDAAGLFAVHALGPAGWRRLRLEPPGAAPFEAAVPFLAPGQSHVLEDLAAGPAAATSIRVLGMDARPVPGALVLAIRLAPTIHPDAHPDWEPAADGTNLPAAARGLTDAGGTAAFPSLTAGEWSFQAMKEGFPPSRPVLRRLDGGPGPETLLLLDPGTVLEGRVLDDATGSPVGGAVVRWTRVIDLPRGHDLRYSGTTSAGADGAFRFPAAPAAGLLLTVGRPGAAGPAGGLAVDASVLGRVDVRLPRATTLAGLCVQSGTGLSAAGVDLRIRVDLRSGVLAISGELYARSGPDGRFEVRGLPEGALVQVDPVPSGPWDPAAGDDGPRPPGMPRRVEVVRAGAIRGRARDAAGRPAAGRVVTALAALRLAEEMPPVARVVSRAISGADGAFRLENVPPGAAAVLCAPPGDAVRFKDQDVLLALGASPRPAFVAEAPPGGEAPVEVVEGEAKAPSPVPSLPAPPAELLPDRISGTVVGPGGGPLPGVRLFAMPGDLGSMFRGPGSWLVRVPGGIPVPVAPDGEFLAEVVPSGRTADARGRPYTLVASAPGFPPAVAVVRAPEGVGGAVRIEVAAGVSLRGRLLREDGSPAAGLLLEAVATPDARSAVNTVMVEARSAEDGAFRIDGLEPVPHTLVVGHAPGPVHRVPGLLPGGDPVEVRLPAGDGTRPERTPVPARSSPAARPGPEAPVRGRLVVEGDAAVRFSRVEILDADRCIRVGDGLLVSPDGRFEGKAPKGSRVAVAAMADDGRWLFADDVPAGEADLVLRLGGTPTGLLRGRVVTPAGAPAGGVPVHAVRLRDRGEGPGVVLIGGGAATGTPWAAGLVPTIVRTTFTAPDGSFDLGSPPGRWAVFAGLPGSAGLAPSAAVPWTAAEAAPLELSAGPGRVLSVRGADDDAPQAAARAVAAEVILDGFLPAPGPALAVRASPGPRGDFGFQGLPAAPVTVRLLDAAGREIGRTTATPGDPRDPPVKVQRN